MRVTIMTTTATAVHVERGDSADMRAATGRLIADATVWNGLTTADGSRYRVFGLRVGRDVSMRRGFGLNTSAGRCSQYMLNRSSEYDDAESLLQRLIEDGRRTQLVNGAKTITSVIEKSRLRTPGRCLTRLSVRNSTIQPKLNSNHDTTAVQ